MLPTLATIGGVPEPERYGFKGRDLTPILSNPKASVQDVLHFTYEDDVFPVKGADCIRAIVEPDWKYAVYYDPFTGAPTEYEMYDLDARSAGDDEPGARVARDARVGRRARAAAPAPGRRDGDERHDPGRNPLAGGRGVSARSTRMPTNEDEETSTESTAQHGQ